VDEFDECIDRCSKVLGSEEGWLSPIELIAALHATNMPDGRRLGALYSVKK
jgi:hypothetical protein